MNIDLTPEELIAAASAISFERGDPEFLRDMTINHIRIQDDANMKMSGN